jgi:putative hydrolase of the HAD superfamily
MMENQRRGGHYRFAPSSTMLFKYWRFFMSDISLVLFDMDNVLCDYRRDTRLARLSELTGLPADFIEQKIFDSGFEDECDKDRDDIDGIVNDINNILGTHLTLNELMDARGRSMKPDNAVLDLANTVSNTTRTAMLTQNGALLHQALPVVFPQVQTIFGNRVFFSYQFGAIKTDVALYDRVLAKLDGVPATTLFIDDDASFVACAAEAGLRTHHFQNAEKLASELTEMGLLK